MAEGVLSVVLSMDDAGFTTTVTNAGQSLNVFNTQINNTVTGVGRLEGSVHSSAASFAAWSEAFHLVEEGFHRLIDVTKEFTDKIIETNSEIQKTTILLEGLSKAQTEAGRAAEAQNNVKSLLDLGANSPFSLNQVTDTFVKMKTVGIDPTNGSLKALMDSIAAFGGDDSRLQRAGYAIQEMAGRGVISLQNLRRQLGQDIPGAVELMARSMNLTIEQLDQKVQSGTLESGHALQLMLEEFQRTYGGASGQLMQTFTGRVSQLTNTLQRLALVAGGQVKPSIEGLFGDASQQGTTNRNGFYASVLNEIGKINDMLKSPEMVASAITLNNTLASVARTAGSFIRTMIEWRDPILRAAEAVTVLGAAFIGLRTITIVNSMLTTMGSALVSLGQMVVGLPARIVAIGSGFSTTLTAINAIGIAIMSKVVPEITLVGTGIEGAAIGVAGLTLGFATLAIPVAVGVGLYAIDQHLKNIHASADVATAALDRLSQGDITKSNQDKAQKELEDMEHTLDVIKQKIDRLNELKNSNVLTRVLDTFGLSKTGGIGDIPGVAASDGSGVQDIKDQIAKLTEEYSKGQDAVTQKGLLLQSAAAERVAAQAKQLADQITQSTEAQFSAVNNLYSQQMQTIKAGREDVGNNPGKGSADADGLTLLDQAAKQAAISQRDGILSVIDDMNNKVEAAYKKSLANHNQYNQEQIQIYAATLAELKQHRDEVAKELEKGAEDQGTQGSNELDERKLGQRAFATAETMIKDAKEKLAQYNAELENTGTYTARLQALMTQPGWDGGFVVKALRELIPLTTELDQAAAAVKRMQEATKAQHEIDMGLDHANEELAMFTQRINNPGMTDGTRQVAQLQGELARQILLMTQNAAASANSLPQFMAALANVGRASLEAGQALNNMKGAMALSEIESLNQQAHNAYIGSLDKVSQANIRAKENTDRVNTAIENVKKSFAAGGMSAEAYSRAMADAFRDKAEINLTQNNKLDAIGAKEAKPSENALNELTASVAKLRAEVNTGSGAVAEWTAKLNAMNGVSAAVRAQILALAAQQEKYTAEVTKTKAAAEALETLKKNVANEQSAVDDRNQASLTGDIFNQRTRTLEVEKQILAYKRLQNIEVNKAKDAQTTSKDPVAAAADVATAEERADKATELYSTNALADAIQKLNEERLKDWKDSHSSAEDQKAEIREEVEQYNALTNKLASESKLSAEQQKEALSDVAAWAQSQFNKIDREHKSVMQKLADGWLDWDKQVKTITESVANSFADSLSTMLETGKANWKKFADDVIKEIERMIVKMLLALAIQQALGVFGGGTGGSNSGVGSVVSSILPKFHSGGIAGDEVPAILQKGEGIFTTSQMGAMGDIHAGYAEMAAAVSKLTQAIGNPSSNALRPSNYNSNLSGQASPLNGTNRGGANAPAITFNLNNQSGVGLSAQADGNPKFNGEQWVVDVIVRNTNKAGPLRTAISNTR